MKSPLLKDSDGEDLIFLDLIKFGQTYRPKCADAGFEDSL